MNIGVKIGHLLIGSTYNGNPDFAAFDSAADKSLQVVSKDSATLKEGPFKVFQKANNVPGGFEFQELIDPKNIEVATLTQYSAPVNRIVNATGFSGTVRGNVTYEVFIRLLNDGGTLSPENFRHILGSYVTPQDASGITFTDVMEGIKKNLDKSLSREYNSNFTITVNADSISVEAGTRDFVLGKKDGRPVEFDLQVAVRDNGGDNTVSDARYNDLDTEVVQAGSAGTGTGNQISLLEWNTAGEKGDRYRTIGYPNNFNTVYFAEPGATYNVVNLVYFEARKYTSVERQYRVLQIAVKADDGVAATNALIADLETVTGLEIAAPLV